MKHGIVITVVLALFNGCNGMDKGSEESNLAANIKTEIEKVTMYTAHAHSIAREISKNLNDFLALDSNSEEVFKEKVGSLTDAAKAVRDARALTRAISDAAEDYSNKFAGQTSQDLSELIQKIGQEVDTAGDVVDTLQQEIDTIADVVSLPDLTEKN
ncbi:MAG: hypothetical protein NTX86_00225 [Candidatus Dependentiae bacterium]|nr:hypothetical protein [Candidatus Dependentiae bacterium]